MEILEAIVKGIIIGVILVWHGANPYKLKFWVSAVVLNVLWIFQL